MLMSKNQNKIVLVILLISPMLHPFASEKLSILLTNDDGVESQGLIVLSSLLRDAGHNVTVIAPASQQSGSGMKVTLGELEFSVLEDRIDTWKVGGSPADAVLVGLHQISSIEEIDLVISGPNFGQNLGTNVFLSGTVGGAMAAVQQGVPAIALSVGIDLAESHYTPERFPSTIASFEPASKFLVSLLAIWSKKPISSIIPKNSLININYPEVGEANIKGTKWIQAGKVGGFSLGYVKKGSSVVKVSISENETKDENAKDLGFFNLGYITLSILTPDWNVPKGKYENSLLQ